MNSNFNENNNCNIIIFVETWQGHLKKYKTNISSKLAEYKTQNALWECLFFMRCYRANTDFNLPGSNVANFLRLYARPARVQLLWELASKRPLCRMRLVHLRSHHVSSDFRVSPVLLVLKTRFRVSVQMLTNFLKY